MNTNERQANALVEAARATESPSHGDFEWDDTKAAEAYLARKQSKGTTDGLK